MADQQSRIEEKLDEILAKQEAMRGALDKIYKSFPTIAKLVGDREFQIDREFIRARRESQLKGWEQ